MTDDAFKPAACPECGMESQYRHLHKRGCSMLADDKPRQPSPEPLARDNIGVDRVEALQRHAATIRKMTLPGDLQTTLHQLQEIDDHMTKLTAERDRALHERDELRILVTMATNEGVQRMKEIKTLETRLAKQEKELDLMVHEMMESDKAFHLANTERERFKKALARISGFHANGITIVAADIARKALAGEE